MSVVEMASLGASLSNSGLQRPFQRALASTQPEARPFVTVDLHASRPWKTDSYYMKQYTRLGASVGKLNDTHRAELLNIFTSAADMMRKTGSFDPEALANSASYGLRSALDKRGVNLGDALKGMLLVFSGNAPKATGDYSYLL